MLTIPIEQQIKTHPLVKECIVFGIGKEVPGVIIIPTNATKTEEEVLNELWPTIKEINTKVEQFSRIMKEMIKILPTNTKYSISVKGVVQRQLFYEHFKSEIEQVYKDAEMSGSFDYKTSSMSLEEIENFILDIFREIGCPIASTTDDLYKSGIDSLQAITVWGHIHRKLTKDVTRNVVYDYSNIKKLSQHVFDLTHTSGHKVETSQNSKEIVKTIQNLIDQYSDFSAYSSARKTNSGNNEYVLLTGATGSLGAHVLEQLLQNVNVRKVYCVVRADDKNRSLDRILQSLDRRNIKRPTNCELEKIEPIPFDMVRSMESDLKKSLRSFIPDITKNLTSVIHCAWPVNFNYGLEFFEPHIKSVSDLIKICLSSERKAKFIFCSSISTALCCPTPVPESVINDLSQSAAPMGYGQSKLVCEHIVKNACSQTGIFARSARIGQIVGDTKNGIWNSTEAYPLMIQSAKVLKALPAIPEMLSWTPVDVVANVILDILFEGEAKEQSLGVDGGDVVYNVTTPKLVDWTSDLLPALKNDAGLEFEVVGIDEWLRRLANSPSDAKVNPTIKLLDHFEKLYNSNQKIDVPAFMTLKTESVSPCLKECENVINSGLVKKFVKGWGLESTIKV